MKRIIVIALLFMGTLVALAQGSVRGKVLDKQTDEVMEFVNVVVETPAGKLVKGAITDVDGQFHITGLKDGNYQLQVSFVGYKTLTRQFTLSAQNRQQQYKALYLAEDAKVLGEVQVTGQRSQMKLEVDRKVFSVDQILAAAGGSASDLLENIPSVEVTTDGEISLRGNSSVEVWINGKASGLTTDNRAEILQQIPAESIERIEVIDNPSAKYSPEGSAGIINIVLKRDRKAGYYGSMRAGANIYGGWNTGANINYSSGVLDAYANLGYRHRKNQGGSESQQNYKQTNEYQNYESKDKNRGGGLFARMGLTWHFTRNDDLSLGGMTLQGNFKNTSMTPYHYGMIDAAQDAYQMFRLNKGDGEMHMYHAELGYEHRWRDNHKLTTHVEYNRWMSDNDNTYQDSVWFVDMPHQQTTYSYQYRPMHIRNRSWEAKLDYENQISENFKIEAGYNGRWSHENTPQESWFADNWEGTGLVEDALYYNRFIYSMDTHALYATINTKVGKLGIMAGVRGEYWKVNTESYDYAQEHGTATKEEPYKKDFFKLFPSLFLNYELTESAQLQLNYTYRLRRPWGGQLNSFRNTSDASMIQFGNPELTPEYTHSISLNFLKTWAEHTLSISTYYRPTTDVMQRIRYQNADDGLMYMTTMNLTKRQSLGVELIGKNKFFRILDLTTTVNGYYNKLDGFTYIIDGQTVTGEGDKSFSWDARMLASLILPYDISVQLTGNYRSRGVITQGYRKPNASVDLGIRKNFFNKKIAVAFNWRDVFNSRHWENYTESDTFWRHQKNWRDPMANIQVTWNFGNMNNQRKHGEREELLQDNDQPQQNNQQQRQSEQPQQDFQSGGGEE
ncbi:MAG: TonB-dependent receptor [Prevotella sp.]|nr:TonB-dependent receptor [Prevotella sp.]